MSFTQRTRMSLDQQQHMVKMQRIYMCGWFCALLKERVKEGRHKYTSLWVFNKSLKYMTIPAIIIRFFWFENAYM